MRALPIAMALVGLTLASCSKPAEEAKGPEATESKEAAEPAELTDVQKAALVAELPAPYSTGDIAHGKQLFAVCKACHTVVKDGANMTGPNLHGIFGRKVGTDAGFTYSDPVKAAGFTWDEAHLDTWLTDPKADIPGTKMTFPGLKDPKDRIDVIAYLKAETSDKPAT